MYERGGNAFDAATAAGFVLQVVEPHLNGPAGDVPILLYDAGAGRAEVICGQGPMPGGATIDAIRALGLSYVPGSGLLPACVPGAFGAWTRLLATHGRLRLSTVLEPAIGYAASGFPLLPQAAAIIDALAPLFREEWTSSGELYLDRGRPPTPWSRMRNPALAATYRRVLSTAAAVGTSRESEIEAAQDAFYRGFVAEAIGEFAANSKPLDATGERHGGFLTADDLARWYPATESPVAVRYRDSAVYKAGPWSQGPVFLQQLTLLEGLPLPELGLASPDYLHTLIECAKLAFADREAWYGDPDYTDVPLEALLSRGYADSRRLLVTAEASHQLQPGAPAGRRPQVISVADPEVASAPHWRKQLSSGIPSLVRETSGGGDTCCVVAADQEGNLVAATPSGGWLKSSPVIPGLGFPLGTRGQMAWLVDGHPNALVPGKRPRTTLSPTIVLRDGPPSLAFGTPGGDQQDQWSLWFFLAHAEFGLGLQAAIETLALHTDHVPSSFVPRRCRPGSLVLERQAGAATRAALELRGHQVELVAEYSLGRVCAAGVEADRGMVVAAASPRGEQAYAVAR